MLEQAAHPDDGGDLVFRQTNALSTQILWCANARVRADIESRMAENARHEGRQPDIGRSPRRNGAQITRERHLGDVEFLVAEHPEEYLFGIERQVGHGTTLDLDPSIDDRTRAVIIAACNR